jgi:hypothetical protein
MKFLIGSFGIWIAILTAMCDGCAYQDLGPPPSVAAVPGFCIEDLTGGTVNQLTFNLLIDETYAQWEKAFPKEFDRGAAERFLEDKPFTIYFVEGDIACTHRGPGSWPGEPARCAGMWPVRATHFFIDRGWKDLHCSAVVHEISHIMAFWFLGDADRNHHDPKIWDDKTGILGRVIEMFGGGC